MKLFALLAGPLLLGGAIFGQAPIAANPAVEVKGRIARVQVTPGQGMPFLEVKEGARTTKVYLGSIRYLMEQNFNPKADDEVEVKGYKVADGVVAREVRLPAQKKTLRLRDEQGRPLWAPGWRRGRMGRQPSGSRPPEAP